MKLITWNCQGAFRKKANEILKHNPDILVVQECEHPSKLIFNSSIQQPKDLLWFGENEHKGIGVFSYSKYRFKLLDDYNPEFKIIAPISVSGGAIDFTLFAVWANNPQDKKNQYVGQVWKAIKHYDAILNVGPTILTGDFNSNTIWDRPSREGNHSTVVEALAGKKIHSIYHKYFLQNQGDEKHATFYLHRDKNKTYHLDYFFVSDDLLSIIKNFEVGTYENWIAHSDHSPLIVEFNLRRMKMSK